MSVTDKLESAVTIGRRDTKRGARQFRLPLAVFSGATAVSLLILKFAPAPFFWLWVTWAAALWAGMFGVRGSWPRAILFNLGIVACLLAALEVYFRVNQYVPPIVTDGFSVPDDVLGWAPAKGIEAHAVKQGPAGLLHGPKGLLYDVTYTIDSDGLRVAPPWRKDGLAGTVLFFGCSYTFGYGLNDNETLPYQVGVQSGGRYRIYNFAFNGYSPAQMLAQIEDLMVSRVIVSTPRYAFYIAIPDHVGRVAGRKAWIKHQPRYALDAAETVHRAGFFDDPAPLALRLGLGRRVAAQLNKSATWQALDLRESNVTEDDIHLYLAMVRRSRDLLSVQYPDIQFRVILRPDHSGAERSTYEKMREGFLEMGFPLDLAEDILPGYKANEAPFILSPADPHPNAQANRLMARYILNQIEH
jgi:hypothetical protein